MVEDDQKRPSGSIHQSSAGSLGLESFSGLQKTKDDENLW